MTNNGWDDTSLDLPIIDLPPYRPSLLARVSQRLRSWWCERFGHDYYGGSGFNGEYTQHWYQCRRCGDSGSD